MPSYKARTADEVDLGPLVLPYADKFAWFIEKGYEPHYYQTLFHSLTNPDKDSLCRFRHLVAGRRGGKTLSAAWELLYYLTHPSEFHRHAHNRESNEKLLCWVLTRDYPSGLPALMTFREVLSQSGLVYNEHYKENKGHRFFEFENGSFLFFKTADEPDALRGAGLDILWLDEAAFIPNENAWNVVRPALSDKLGCVISTTTPSGKNWFYNEFWGYEAMQDNNIGRVEYWSIDNPYFSQEEWEYVKTRMHPLLFKQEFCAAFDSMAGKELSGDWLHYYVWDELPKKEGKLDLNFYIGVDPAVSLSDKADRFSIACIGVTKDHSQAWLIDQFTNQIPFPEQIDKIHEWFYLYRPISINIESNAYQAALAQQASRLEGLPPIVAQMSKGKKFERILTMAPLFRMGRIKIRKEHIHFINEWIDYDSTLKNPQDDSLDAVEIALRGVVSFLPVKFQQEDPIFLDWEDKPPISLQEIANRAHQLIRQKGKKLNSNFDDHLGVDW